MLCRTALFKSNVDFDPGKKRNAAFRVVERLIQIKANVIVICK